MSLDSFFIIAFASYVESQKDFSQTFFKWLQVCSSNSGMTQRDRSQICERAERRSGSEWMTLTLTRD